MSATELERRNRDRAILRVLWNRPLIATELFVVLSSLEELPRHWTTADLRRVLRRLHKDGRLSRLDAPVSRSVLWWAH